MSRRYILYFVAILQIRYFSLSVDFFGKYWFWLLCGPQKRATNFPCQRYIKIVAFAPVFFLTWMQRCASDIAEGTGMHRYCSSALTWNQQWFSVLSQDRFYSLVIGWYWYLLINYLSLATARSTQARFMMGGRSYRPWKGHIVHLKTWLLEMSTLSEEAWVEESKKVGASVKFLKLHG